MSASAATLSTTPEDTNLVLQLLDKDYQVRCPRDKASDLRSAAKLLDSELRKVRDSVKVIGLERIAITAALNIAFELCRIKRLGEQDQGDVGQRVDQLVGKIRDALTQNEQMAL